MSFPLVYAYSIRLFVKTLQDECINSSYLVCYKDECDTCDSKNDKTPVYTRAREGHSTAISHLFSEEECTC